MARRGLILVILAAGVAPMALALNPLEKPQNAIAKHWDTEDGLPHNSVKQLFQTRDGYLWIGTDYGLGRFDGLNFTVFNRSNTPTLGNNRITSFAETGDGSLWIGTGDSVVRYLNGQFTSYAGTKALKITIINALCVAPDGSLWIGGREGVTRWVDGKFVDDIDTSGYDTAGMRAITVDRNHAVWLATGAQALRYQDGAFTAFGHAEGLPTQAVLAISEDADGRILAVTQGGLLRLEDNHFVPFEQSSALASSNLTKTLVDRAGNLWIGSVKGLDRYSAGKVLRYSDRTGHNYGLVNVVFEDREGCLWVGTGAGLDRLTDRRAYSLSVEDGLPGNVVSSVLQTRDGTLWIGCWGAGVAQFKDGKVSRDLSGATLSHDTVTAIYEGPDGTMWFGNRGSSIDRFDGSTVTTTVYQPGVPSSRPVTALLADDDGTLLVGIASRGLLRLRGGEITPVPQAGAVAKGTVWSLYRTRHNQLLMGTSLGLFQQQADRSWQPLSLSGLPGPVVVRSFFEEADGELWLATEGYGLVRWQNGHALAYGAEKGMIDDLLFSVTGDGRGSLWMSSVRGIARIRKSELNDLDRGRISILNCLIFGRVDGLLSASSPGTGSPAAGLLSDGRLVFATDRGVAMIDPRTVHTNSQPPTVVLESVAADDKRLPLGPALTLAAGTNRVEFRYTALSLISPERLRFRYLLEGSDTQWIDAGRERSARYNHLAPGHYTFQLAACNNDGVWAQTGLTVPLTMLPFFYQTLWFRLTALVVLLGLVPVLVWLRLRQMSRRQAALKHANAELDERVQARTAELAETYRRLMEASHLAGMAEVATEVLHNVGNVLNSVNVSTNVLSEGLRRSRLGHVVRLSKLLQTQADNLPAFLTVDPRGSRVLPFLDALAVELTAEQQQFLAEVESLQQNVEHIKQIVAMQQSHARVSGVVETVAPIELFEDALRMKGESLARHGVELIREFSPTPAIFVERHKVLQILVNLIQNAKQAILEGPNRSQCLLLRLQAHEEHVRFIITDNGIGIAKENLARIFSHGFTTRAKGHGFGLHSAANAAKQMNGTLQAYSDGAGCGATFILQLPMVKLDGSSGNFDR